MKPEMHISGLSHAYGDLRVLENISLEIPRGSFTIIIGPNGSGKTTLLKTLTGIIHPQQGSVRLGGRPLEAFSRKELARRIAYVPQQIPWDFPFTAEEVVLLGRTPHLGLMGLEQQRDYALARNAMERAGIDHLSGRILDHLSGGERQQVFIARAVCQQPQLLLLDEPTAALDPSHQVRIMDLLEKLKQDHGITVIMVSHDINLACMYADTLVLLSAGRVLQQGAPEAVITRRWLEHAYGCPIAVDRSPCGNVPRITPIPAKLRGRRGEG